MSNLKYIKLLTGEELLAELLPRIPGSAPNEVSIKNPVRIIVMPNRVDPKTPSIGFAPWLEFAEDKTVTLDKSHVVAILTPIKQFDEQYRQMFSPIMVPGQQGLILPGA